MIASILPRQTILHLSSPPLSKPNAYLHMSDGRSHPTVIPRNYLLFACHATNATAQLIQCGRWAQYWKFGGREQAKGIAAKVSRRGLSFGLGLGFGAAWWGSVRFGRRGSIGCGWDGPIWAKSFRMGVERSPSRGGYGRRRGWLVQCCASRRDLDHPVRFSRRWLS